jgi:hypothetical protein
MGLKVLVLVPLAGVVGQSLSGAGRSAGCAGRCAAWEAWAVGAEAEAASTAWEPAKARRGLQARTRAARC